MLATRNLRKRRTRRSRSRNSRQEAGIRYGILGILAVTAGSLIACGSSRSESVGVWMGDPRMELPVGIPAERLPDASSRGAGLHARYCSQCHGIPSPGRHSARDWEPTTRRMFQRMEHMTMIGLGPGTVDHRPGDADVAIIEMPSLEEERAILEYLTSHALESVERDRLPDADGEEAELYAYTCSRCHALPDPSQKSPVEWATVVGRMRGHMDAIRVVNLSDDEAGVILTYLQAVARP